MPKTITMVSGTHQTFVGSTYVEVFTELEQWLVNMNTDKRQHFYYILTWMTMIRVDRNPDEGDYSDWYIAQCIFEFQPKPKKGG